MDYRKQHKARRVRLEHGLQSVIRVGVHGHGVGRGVGSANSANSARREAVNFSASQVANARELTHLSEYAGADTLVSLRIAKCVGADILHDLTICNS